MDINQDKTKALAIALEKASSEIELRDTQIKACVVPARVGEFSELLDFVAQLIGNYEGLVSQVLSDDSENGSLVKSIVQLISTMPELRDKLITVVQPCVDVPLQSLTVDMLIDVTVCCVVDSLGKYKSIAAFQESMARIVSVISSGKPEHVSSTN